MIAGEAFYLKASVFKDGHVWVAAYCNASEGMIIVNMTSNLTFDQTCLLGVGDHAFITKPTLIAYEHARLLDPTLVADLEARGIDRKIESVSPKILKRIQEGIRDSRHTSRRMKKLIAPALSPANDR